MTIKKTLVQEGWYETEESGEQCVLNDSTGLIWGLESMSLKSSYEFIMMILSLEWWREHWKLFINSVKTVLKKPFINRESNIRRSQFSYTVIVVT